MDSTEGADGQDWRPVVAALANGDARIVWARLIVGDPARAAALSSSREGRALALLERAGLVHTVDGRPEPDEAVFRRLLAAAGAAHPKPVGVQRFLHADGRIDRYPAGAQDRRELLTHIAASVLSPGETLSERELTERLARLSDDPVALRRHLVDADLLMRTPSGSEYRRHDPE